MKILVTGGAGYIGSTLVPLLLAEGHQVRVLDKLLHGGEGLLGVWSHQNFEFVGGDITDASARNAALQDVNAVIHLAAIVGDPACARNPDLARSVNINGSLELLEECCRRKVSRFVFASTCSNYGKMLNSDDFVDENSPLSPVSLYAETKVAVEEAVLKASGRGHGLCLTPLRLATVFGVSPRMRFDLTVNEFTAELVLHRHLVVFGEQFWRPYIHVRDVGRAVLHVLKAAPDQVNGRVFNVGSTRANYQKEQLVDLIREIVPDGRVEYVHKQEDPRDYRVSFARIQAELGYSVERTVASGIAEVARLVKKGVVKDPTDCRYRN